MPVQVPEFRLWRLDAHDEVAGAPSISLLVELDRPRHSLDVPELADRGAHGFPGRALASRVADGALERLEADASAIRRRTARRSPAMERLLMTRLAKAP